MDNDLRDIVNKVHTSTMRGQLLWHETANERARLAVLGPGYSVRIRQAEEGPGSEGALSLSLHEGRTELFRVSSDAEEPGLDLASMLAEIWEAARGKSSSVKPHLARASHFLDEILEAA